MKKFYILFFAGFVILSALLYLSVWWFIGGVAVIAAGTIYHFYNARLKANDASIEELESQVEELQMQLDRSLLKEEKATKEAAQIRQAKQELLTVISHEIRTPMNGVLGMALLLEDTELTKEQKEYTDTIKKSGKSLLSTVNDLLVNDILDYSKLDKKGKKIEAIDFDLRDTIEEVLNMFANKANKAGLDLLYTIDQAVPLQLNGDNKRLREILMNLLENAVKYTHHGEVVVAVDSLHSESDKNELSFEIKDSGIGIPADQVRHLFYNAAGKEFISETEKQGTGLIICRKHVELMGGKIDVKSQPGEGSTFIFTLPFAMAKTPVTASSQQDSHPLNGKHILIADDNLASRTILLKQLKEWGVRPVVADSGMQALDLLSQPGTVDILITDMNMPQLGGVQLAKLVKSKYPSLPVILLNPGGSEMDKQEQILFTAVIAKPVRQNDLKDAILATINKNIMADQSNAGKLEDNFATQFPLQILIAEDNLINQKIAIKILTKLGYQPAIANNGQEAVDMYQQNQYDIILMDVQMPVMDGLEATRTIRSGIKTQPVIMAMTANVLQGDRDACLQAGMDDYISKPINLEELLSHLEKWALVIKERQRIAG